MEQNGEQVPAEHRRRERLLAMPKVMRQMSALRLAHIVVRICPRPPAPTSWRDLRPSLCRQVRVGEKGVGREWCAGVGGDHGELDPVD